MVSKTTHERVSGNDKAEAKEEATLIVIDEKGNIVEEKHFS